MSIRALFAASLFALIGVGCNVGPDPMDGDSVEVASSEQALVTCSTRCGSATTLSCSGATCSAVDGPTGYVTCDGVTRNCKQCTFAGISYPDGVYLGGICTSKYDGVCEGPGPKAGNACVSSGQCYALCRNGVWY
jgi:hypothetical protein